MRKPNQPYLRCDYEYVLSSDSNQVEYECMFSVWLTHSKLFPVYEKKKWTSQRSQMWYRNERKCVSGVICPENKIVDRCNAKQPECSPR